MKPAFTCTVLWRLGSPFQPPSCCCNCDTMLNTNCDGHSIQVYCRGLEDMALGATKLGTPAPVELIACQSTMTFGSL